MTKLNCYVLGSAMLLSLLLISCSSLPKGPDGYAAQEILDKCEKATDPQGKAKTIKSSITSGKMTLLGQRISINFTQIFKAPDKHKEISGIAGMIQIDVVDNGKQCWTNNSMSGFRVIKGQELSSMRLFNRLSDPSVHYPDMFATITVAPEKVKVGQYSCYKITCVPKKEYPQDPIILLIDDMDFLVRQSTVTLIQNAAKIKLTLQLENYRKDSLGILVPYQSETTVAGNKSVSQITDIKYNVNVDDKMFEVPKGKEKYFKP